LHVHMISPCTGMTLALKTDLKSLPAISLLGIKNRDN